VTLFKGVSRWNDKKGQNPKAQKKGILKLKKNDDTERK